MKQIPLEGRVKCPVCGKEYDWFYHRLVRFQENENSKIKYYDGVDGKVYDGDHRSSSNLFDTVLNCDMVFPVQKMYIPPYFWGFNVIVKCTCGQRDTVFVDLRESAIIDNKE